MNVFISQVGKLRKLRMINNTNGPNGRVSEFHLLFLAPENLQINVEDMSEKIKLTTISYKPVQ